MTQRILFLGCGAAARTHSRILRRMPSVELSFASRDEARAAAYCRDFHGREAYGCYATALRREFDIAVVATTPSTHLKLTLDALRARCHVVVEKPAFMLASDCDIARAEARACARRVLVAENYAYKPAVSIIREAVESCELGQVRFVSINATKRQPTAGWRRDPSLGGGSNLFEGGIHWLSFVASLGLDVVSVEGHRAGSDDSSLVVIRYANGAVGTLAFSWELAAPLGGLRLSKIQGTKGAITFESNGFLTVQSGLRRSLRLPAFLDPTGTRAMWRDFLWALETGAETAYTLDMAQRDLRHVERASESLHPLHVNVEYEGRVRRDGPVRAAAVAE